MIPSPWPSDEFPGPEHWLAIGEHARSLYLDVFDPSIEDGGGIDGELRTGCGDGCNYIEELVIEGEGWSTWTGSPPPMPLSALADLVAATRARVPGCRVGLTTDNYERYLARCSLERAICVHEVPKLVALDSHFQISYVFRKEPCDGPCRVSIEGPAIPSERKAVLRDAVRRLDVGALRTFLEGWLAPLLPLDVNARIVEARGLGAGTLSRLGLDDGEVAGVCFGIVDEEGWWQDWKTPEFQSARDLVANAVREPSGMASLRERLAACRDGGASTHRFAWIVHALAARMLRDLEKARSAEAQRFPAFAWVVGAGTGTAAGQDWDRLVMLVKKLVAESTDLLSKGGERDPARIVPTTHLSAPAAESRRAPLPPRPAVLVARLRAALAVAEESDPVSAVFDARVALKRSPDGGAPDVTDALRELAGEIALGESCDLPNDWRAMDLAPYRRTCERLAALA